MVDLVVAVGVEESPQHISVAIPDFPPGERRGLDRVERALFRGLFIRQIVLDLGLDRLQLESFQCGRFGGLGCGRGQLEKGHQCGGQPELCRLHHVIPSFLVVVCVRNRGRHRTG